MPGFDPFRFTTVWDGANKPIISQTVLSIDTSRRKFPDKIYFATSNQKKVLSLSNYFKSIDLAIQIEGVNIAFIEPQSASVTEVSRLKALQAFEQLRAPLIVEDGGFSIAALNGFPGVYSRYILDTIGVEGILALMVGKANRECCFVSTTTYVDSDGVVKQFERLGGQGMIAQVRSEIVSPLAWSVFWSIFWVPRFQKMLCELDETQVGQLWESPDQKKSIHVFADWLAAESRKSNQE